MGSHAEMLEGAAGKKGGELWGACGEEHQSLRIEAFRMARYEVFRANDDKDLAGTNAEVSFSNGLTTTKQAAK